MKLSPNQLAPTFKVNDVFGNSIELSQFKGQKLLLCFHRFVGCPVCNLRVHELEQLQHDNVQVVHIYESKPESIRGYLEDSPLLATVIADPHSSLYQLYGVELSWWQFLYGFVRSGMFKGMKGVKLFKGGMKGMPMPDSSMKRIPADFVIDENGKILEAYYGKYFGDELPIARIKQLIQ